MDDSTDVSRSRVFDGLTDGERHAWLDGAVPRDLRRAHMLARQGEPARSFYLVESGLLKLTQLTEDGREVIVRFVGPGEPFGGVVALDEAAYPVSAMAAQPTRLRAWPSDALHRLLERFPQVRRSIMREMTVHMTDALTRVRELTSERVDQRLAHTLLRLMRQCGRPTPEGVLIAHPLTRQELAEMTGSTLYTDAVEDRRHRPLRAPSVAGRGTTPIGAGLARTRIKWAVSPGSGQRRLSMLSMSSNRHKYLSSQMLSPRHNTLTIATGSAIVALIKRCAAEVNEERVILASAIAPAIRRAAQEVEGGAHDEHFQSISSRQGPVAF